MPDLLFNIHPVKELKYSPRHRLCLAEIEAVQNSVSAKIYALTLVDYLVVTMNLLLQSRTLDTAKQFQI